MKLSDVTALVVDHGLFMEDARALGKVYKKVYYYCPWETAFPKITIGQLGQGVPEIELIDSPFRKLNEINLFVFNDVNFGPLQEHLVSLGFRVWGSRSGEELELDRVGVKKKMEELGLAVGNYTVIKGITLLREFLKHHRNVWVKISKWRGSFESFQSKSQSFIESRLKELDWRLGPMAEQLEFVVEANLPGKFEVAVDAYCVNGQFPNKAMYGIEVKSVGYIGMITDYSKIPEPITRYDQAMTPYLKKVGYKGRYSAECRIGKDLIPYMVDHCARCGSPPSELQSTLWANMPEIVWEGANGNCVDIQPRKMSNGKPAIFGAELMIHSNRWGDTNWQQILFPEDYRDLVKLRNCVRIEGKWYIVPQGTDSAGVGAAIGYGSTIEEAVAQAQEVAKSIEGISIDIEEDALDKAHEEVEKARSFGLNIFR